MKESNKQFDDVKASLHTEALKLADEILLCTTDPLHSKTSAMIRRLVEELDEKNYRILELTKRYKALTWNDKQSEPVVYWDSKNFASKEKSSLADIPLYTTPQTKPLSDEEIVTIWEKANYESQYYEASDNFAIEFAKAIEERHGIK